MPTIRYQDATYQCREEETVLDALLRQGANAPFSCRNGVCLTCMRRCVAGTVPAAAQAALRPGWRALGYFLACRCIPQSDMEIEAPRAADLFDAAVVHAKNMLSPSVCRIWLEPHTAISYRAGQFVNLRRPDGLTRSYSLASVREEDYFLELHVQRKPGGAMSNWLIDELQEGDTVEIQGPNGDGYYEPDRPDRPMLLVCTGSGLAPMLGTVREALLVGHTGEIWLYHGSHHPHGLYEHGRVLKLAEEHPNLRYHPCVSGNEVPAGFLHGRAHRLAFARHTELNGWLVCLAGQREMVEMSQALALRAGVHPGRLFADPFETDEARRAPRSAADDSRCGEQQVPPPAQERFRQPPPDLEMWAALRQGELLRAILIDFYTRAFQDPLLAPYFRGVTIDRLIGKVYSFMLQAFTGGKVYMGDRPLSAHHWMVIPDEIFDYRESLMESCLRRHGLAQPLIERWLAIEESARPDIVKTKPWKRVVGGVEQPIEGFGEARLEVGTLCDACMREIAPGEQVRYHRFLGATYCGNCTGLQPVTA